MPPISPPCDECAGSTITESIAYIPPADAKANYWRQFANNTESATEPNKPLRDPGLYNDFDNHLFELHQESRTCVSSDTVGNINTSNIVNSHLAMYRLPHYDVQQLQRIHALIHERPFATLVFADNTGVVANHVPVLLRPGETPNGLLVGHVAKANPVWSGASSGKPALVIFQGVDHYISPRWYPSSGSNATALPTWDYAVVHVHGSIEWIHDQSWLKGLLKEMTAAFEREAEEPWDMSNLPAEYFHKMLGGIVGFRIPIQAIQGKFKLNQRSSAEDRAGVIAGLNELGTDSARAMATAISKAVEK